VLVHPGDLTAHVYFPTGSFISLIAMMQGHGGLEVGMVGNEGMLGTQLVLGVTKSPLQALVQGSGPAWRIKSGLFTTELARNIALQRNLKRYVHVTMTQLASSAACLRFHQIGPRLARWLLMSQDRAHASQFHVTHEFLALMLGVRRVGVTTAAGELHRQGLIDYHRGEILVVNREGLEEAACSCYAENRQAYAALLPGSNGQP
jgi:CRP-like cAMP-binding protein